MARFDHLDAVERVKDWTRSRFQLDDAQVVMVSEASPKLPGYPPYEALTFEVPVLPEGDVNARVWIRIREVEQSLGLLRQLLDRLPSGATRTPLEPAAAGGRGVGRRALPGPAVPPPGADLVFCGRRPPGDPRPGA